MGNGHVTNLATVWTPEATARSLCASTAQYSGACGSDAGRQYLEAAPARRRNDTEPAPGDGLHGPSWMHAFGA
jgi:hypothetical protein